MRKQPLLERKKRLKAILPRDRLIAFSPHRKANGTNSCQSEDEAATTWVRPSLVAEVKFAEWTSKGELRQPVYLGLRSDKRATDVVRERERPRY